MFHVNQVRRIVIKVGTSTLTHATGKLNLRRIDRLTRCVADLENRGYQVVLVSSGAIGVGAKKLRLPERPTELRMKQAAAAVGQCELMHIYDKMFLEYGVTVAQILLTAEDVVDHSSRRQNVHNTFSALMETGVIPIVNENDSVSVKEIQFGDNDSLSADVAKLCEADLLVIFTDIDGLYDDNPNENPEARLIRVVRGFISDKLRKAAGGAGTKFGTGGMATKLNAAEICMNANIPMFVVNGSEPEILFDLLDGRLEGTLFLPPEQTE